MAKIQNKDWRDSIENHFKEAEVQNKGESLESGDLVQYQCQVTKRKNEKFEGRENKGEKKWRTQGESEKWPTDKEEEEGQNHIIEINSKKNWINMHQIKNVIQVINRAGKGDLQKDRIAGTTTHDAEEAANRQEDLNLLRLTKRLRYDDSHLLSEEIQRIQSFWKNLDGIFRDRRNTGETNKENTKWLVNTKKSNQGPDHNEKREKTGYTICRTRKQKSTKTKSIGRTE